MLVTIIIILHKHFISFFSHNSDAFCTTKRNTKDRFFNNKDFL